nr:DoxX family protein [Actinoalloteichus spitiensis]
MLATLVVVITAAINLGIAVADLVRAPFVLANSAEVGVPERWLPALAALKAAGALGLVLGLLGVTWVGVAAATGLVLFYLGAIAAHIRARVLHNLAFPALFLGGAVASFVVLLPP